MSAALACVKCAKFLRRKKNGVVVEEGRPLDHDSQTWGPYKLWMADLFVCPGCGTEVVSGFAQQNFAEHFEPDYNAQRAKHLPLVTVNDCGGAKP